MMWRRGGGVVKMQNKLCIAFRGVTCEFSNTVGMVFLKINTFLMQLMLEKTVLCSMACLSFVSCQLEALLVSIGCLPATF